MLVSGGPHPAGKLNGAMSVVTNTVLHVSNWNYADLFERVAMCVPEWVAQIHGDRQFTWAEMDRRADALAADLLKRGLREQSKVAAYLYNGPEYLETYFAARGEGAPVKTIDAIVKSRAFHPSAVQMRLEAAQRDSSPPPDANPGCKTREATREMLRVGVNAMMDSLKLDALIYPTWSNPPRLIGDLNTPAGDNSQLFSPSTGFPAITVPMGYTRGNKLPAGMTFFGRAWSEGRLITLASGYEHATHHRRSPPMPVQEARR